MTSCALNVAATAPRQQSTVALTTGGTVPTSSVTTALTSTCGGRESSVEVLTAGKASARKLKLITIIGSYVRVAGGM